MGRAEDLIRTSGNWPAVNDARDACHAYFKEFPNGPAVGDMRTTYEFFMGFEAIALGSKGKIKELSGLADIMMAHFSVPVPPVLSNGMVTSLRIADSARQELVRNQLRRLVDMEAAPLAESFEQAHAKLRALLVNHQPKAKLEGLTFEAAMDQANIHYRAYENGDLEAAKRGFEWLREMSPEDAYAHQMLGSIAAKESRVLDALDEFLLAYHFDPGAPGQAYNAMWWLLRLGFHPLAFEIWRHYQRCGRGRQDPEKDLNVVALAHWAQVGTAMLMMPCAGVKMEHYTPHGPDLLASFEPSERPWLVAPPPLEPALLDKQRIFISYRRSDEPALSERLEHELARRYPGISIFRDVTRMKGGQRFTLEITKALDEATAVFILIGSSWSTQAGIRRLHTPDDYVCMEAAYALKRGVFVVPILIEGAPVPQGVDLPDNIREIASLHAERLRSESFGRDVDCLLAALANAAQEEEARTDEFMAMMEYSNELSEKDPEGAELFSQRTLGLAKEELHHSYTMSAPLGQGIPSKAIKLAGSWQCRALKNKQELFVLSFRTSDAPRSPVVGEKTLRDRAGRVTANIALEGRWHTLKDPDQNRVLGIILEVVEDNAEVREIVVPFHKMLGPVVIGTDDNGVSFNSRKLD